MRSWMLATAGFVFLYARPVATHAFPGRLEERVRTATDTSQTFALYLPPGYTTERRWPVLFVLDPRGRALLGLQLFQDRAARLGWVILSSLQHAERRSARAQRQRRECDAGVGAGASVARPDSIVSGGLLGHRAGRVGVRRRAPRPRGRGDRCRRCAGILAGRSGDGVRG